MGTYTVQREMDLERMERCRFKQRISEVLRASLRSSCSIASREVSYAVQEPVFVPHRYNDRGSNEQNVLHRLHQSLPPLPSQHRRLCTHRQHEMAVDDRPRLPADFGRCRSHAMAQKSEKKCRKKDGRVMGSERRTCPPTSQHSPSFYCFEKMREELEAEERRIAMKKKEMAEGDGMKKKKLLSNSYGFTSSSSEDSDDDGVQVLFGSDETETLFSSRSFSSDSSEFYYSSSCRYSRRRKKKTPQRLRRRQKPREEDVEQSRHCSPLRDGFRPLVSISSSSSSSSCSYLSGAVKTHEEEMAAEVMEEGEEMERGSTAGFAVEKQSSDPHEDFRSSMLEMIMEKQVVGGRELENLLLRYLSLNAPRHHPIIVEVFSEIRETLFGH